MRIAGMSPVCLPLWSLGLLLLSRTGYVELKELQKKIPKRIETAMGAGSTGDLRHMLQPMLGKVP